MLLEAAVTSRATPEFDEIVYTRDREEPPSQKESRKPGNASHLDSQNMSDSINIHSMNVTESFSLKETSKSPIAPLALPAHQ